MTRIKWLIEYSVRYATGYVKNNNITLDSGNMTEALATAEEMLIPIRACKDVKDALIWSIRLVDEELADEFVIEEPA